MSTVISGEVGGPWIIVTSLSKKMAFPIFFSILGIMDFDLDFDFACQ